MPEFELLCDNLHLTPVLEDADQLQRLKTWYLTKVSSDISFSGSPAEQYKHYLKAAKRYTNSFLANKLDNMSAIQYAAVHGYDHFLTMQREAPEAFDQADQDGMTPLHWAAYKGHVNTVKTLLAQGANPEKLNNESQLPIYSALLVPSRPDKTLFSHKHEIFKILLEKAPEAIKHQDKSGDSVFHLMAGDDHFNDLLVEWLKDNPSILSSPNNLKQYPIHTAVLNNKIKNARSLLESNTGVDRQCDKNNRVALHYAAKHGCEEMINLCIATTADKNIRDTYSKTPLIIAAENGKYDAVNALLHHGANPDLVDCDQQNYLDHMRHRSQNDF